MLMSNLEFINHIGLFSLTITEFFGIVSMLFLLAGFYLYGKHVFTGRIKPNIPTWAMWCFGEMVDLITYDSISGSSWTTNAGPFACMLGVFLISALIVFQHIQYAHKKIQVKY